MLKERAVEYSRDKNCNCAESTLLAFSDEYGLGLGAEDAKLMGGFGGGLASGLACGALCGSLAALGKLLLPGPAHAMGGTDCRELREKYFEPGKGCVRAIEKNAVLLSEFVSSRGLSKDTKL